MHKRGPLAPRERHARDTAGAPFASKQGDRQASPNTPRGAMHSRVESAILDLNDPARARRGRLATETAPAEFAAPGRSARKRRCRACLQPAGDARGPHRDGIRAPACHGVPSCCTRAEAAEHVHPDFAMTQRFLTVDGTFFGRRIQRDERDCHRIRREPTRPPRMATHSPGQTSQHAWGVSALVRQRERRDAMRRISHQEPQKTSGP